MSPVHKESLKEGKKVVIFSTGPVTRETTRSSKAEAVFSDDKGYYFAEPEKLQEILCFLPVIVFIFKRGYRTAGEEFVETKRGFCWEHAPSQKPLSVFTQQSHFKRFELIFEA
jgi:hypothetical protein